MSKSIAVIGSGFVGGSLTTVFAERGTTVYAYDKSGVYKPGAQPVVMQTQEEAGAAATLRYPNSIEELVLHAEQQPGFTKIYFCCLPTPMNVEDGSCNLDIIDGVLERLAKIPGDRIAVVKSTVPPGTVETWNQMFRSSGLTVIFNPEFLVERTALDDMRNQDRIILGGPRPQINKVKQLYQSMFTNVPIVKTSSTNAEMVKYVANCFLATKVSFANEIYQIVEGLAKEGLDVDYDRVIECATLDKRLGTTHWKVPSLETDDAGNPLFGFSLSCFPKDINAMINLARSLGVDPKVLRGAWEKNVEVRPGRDWEKMHGRAVSKKES